MVSSCWLSEPDLSICKICQFVQFLAVFFTCVMFSSSVSLARHFLSVSSSTSSAGFSAVVLSVVLPDCLSWLVKILDLADS